MPLGRLRSAVRRGHRAAHSPKSFPERRTSCRFAYILSLRYTQISMRCLGVFLCTLTLFGQSARVSSTTAAPGEKVTIEIALDAPSGKGPLAMQWEAAVPAGALKLDESGFVSGAAAKAADKSLTCAPRKTRPDLSKWACILAGGQKPIANGVVAVLRLTVQTNAHAGPHLVVVDNLLGVSASLKRVPMPRAEGVVTVTR